MKKPFAALAFLTLGGMLFGQAAASPAPQSIEELEDAVLVAIGQGRQAEAESLLIQHQPSFGDYRQFQFMDACLRRSRFATSEALELFANVILAYPYDVLGATSFLVRQIELGVAPEEYWKELVSVAAKNQDSVWVLWMLAVEARTLGKTDVGIQTCRALFSKLPRGTALMHQTYANLMDEVGEYDEALQHRWETIKLEDKGWSRDGLANTLSYLGRNEEALQNYRLAMQMSPDRATFISNCGLLLAKMSRNVEANELFARAATLSPQWAQVWYLWGASLSDMGQLDAAREKLRKALELDPDHELAGALSAQLQ